MLSPLPDGWTVAVFGCGSAGVRHARHMVDCGVPPEAIHGYDMQFGDRQADWPAGAPLQRLRPEDIGHVEADVVVISTPAIDHANLLAACARSHRLKAVLCEKPLSSAVTPQLEALVTALEDRQVVAQVGYCWRWHPAVTAAMDWTLQCADLGSVLAHATVAVDMRAWPGQQYGPVLPELSHEIDSLTFLLGPGRAERAFEAYGGWRIEIVHHTGARSVADILGNHGGYLRSLDLLARDGAYRWHTTDFQSAGVWLNRSPFKDWTPARMYAAQMADFLAAAARRGPVRCTLRSALEVLRLCDAATALVTTTEASA